MINHIRSTSFEFYVFGIVSDHLAESILKFIIGFLRIAREANLLPMNNNKLSTFLSNIYLPILFSCLVTNTMHICSTKNKHHYIIPDFCYCFFFLDVLLAIEFWWIYELDLHNCVRNQETCSKAVEKSRPRVVSVVLVCRRV